jgi:hypothetical protein
MLSLSLLKYQQ